MKNIYLFSMIILLVIPSFSESESRKSGHISLMEGMVDIYRDDNAIKHAKLNSYLQTGDTIITGKNGFCEIQFPNGTLLRLNSESEITIISYRLKTATSRKFMTTLKVSRGSAYSISKSYNREIFQIVTNLVALKSPRGATTLIGVFPGGENFINVLRGRAVIKYGKDKIAKMSRKDKAIFLKNGKKNSLTISYWNGFIKKNMEINRNFKELHYGKSDLPDKIYRYSKGLVINKEKYSDKFGRWNYTKRFGYAWFPYDFSFIAKRPFQDANVVEIDGETALIPNQMYGWIPYLMGNWIWSASNGWIWIPGNSDIEFISNYRNKYMRDLFYPGDFLNVWIAGLLWNPYFTNIDFPTNSIPEQNSYSLKPTGQFKIVRKKMFTSLKHDWNPDSRLKKKRGIRLKYIPKKNDAVLTILNRKISGLNGFQKFGLKRLIISTHSAGDIGKMSRNGTNIYSVINNSLSTGEGTAASNGLHAYSSSGGSSETRGTGGESKKN